MKLSLYKIIHALFYVNSVQKLGTQFKLATISFKKNLLDQNDVKSRMQIKQSTAM